MDAGRATGVTATVTTIGVGGDGDKVAEAGERGTVKAQ